MQIFNVLIEIGRVARRVYVYMLAHSIDFFLVRSRLLILLSFFFYFSALAYSLGMTPVDFRQKK